MWNHAEQLSNLVSGRPELCEFSADVSFVNSMDERESGYDIAQSAKSVWLSPALLCAFGGALREFFP